MTKKISIVDVIKASMVKQAAQLERERLETIKDVKKLDKLNQKEKGKKKEEKDKKVGREKEAEDIDFSKGLKKKLVIKRNKIKL